MRIYSVQNYTPNYKGSFIRDYSIREFEKHLSGTEKETYDNIIKSIENTNDNNQWWFGVRTIRNGALKIASIGKMNPDGTPRTPGYFLDEAKNSLDLFKRLETWYKNNVEGYKG